MKPTDKPLDVIAEEVEKWVAGEGLAHPLFPVAEWEEAHERARSLGQPALRYLEWVKADLQAERQRQERRAATASVTFRGTAATLAVELAPKASGPILTLRVQGQSRDIPAWLEFDDNRPLAVERGYVGGEVLSSDAVRFVIAAEGGAAGLPEALAASGTMRIVSDLIGVTPGRYRMMALTDPAMLDQWRQLEAVVARESALECPASEYQSLHPESPASEPVIRFLERDCVVRAAVRLDGRGSGILVFDRDTNRAVGSLPSHLQGDDEPPLGAAVLVPPAMQDLLPALLRGGTFTLAGDEQVPGVSPAVGAVLVVADPGLGHRLLRAQQLAQQHRSYLEAEPEPIIRFDGSDCVLRVETTEAGEPRLRLRDWINGEVVAEALPPPPAVVGGQGDNLVAVPRTEQNAGLAVALAQKGQMRVLTDAEVPGAATFGDRDFLSFADPELQKQWAEARETQRRRNRGPDGPLVAVYVQRWEGGDTGEMFRRVGVFDARGPQDSRGRTYLQGLLAALQSEAETVHTKNVVRAEDAPLSYPVEQINELSADAEDGPRMGA